MDAIFIGMTICVMVLVIAIFIAICKIIDMESSHKEEVEEYIEYISVLEKNKLDPDMPTQELLLHMGELTKEEILVARAAIRFANNFA